MCRTSLTTFGLLVVCLFSSGRLEAQRPAPQRNPVEETAAYLVKAHDSIALTRSRMQDLQTQIERVRAQLDAAKISPEAKEKIRGALNKSEPLVRTGLGHLQTWEDATGKVKHGMDLYGEMKGMVSIAQGLDPKAGDLGTHLKALSDLLDTYRGEVPLIGPFLQAYGQVTNAMLGSLDRLSQNFDEVVRQGYVGGETSTLVPHRNKVLFNQKPDGETVFREFLYAPCGPSYAYKPVGTEPNTESRVLLWDESADYWYVIKHNVRVERVYADHLLIDIDLNPAQMARQLRQDIYKKSQERRDKAEPLFKYLNDNMAAIALCNTADTTGIAVHKLDLFRARFAYVPEYPDKVQTMMRQLFDCACKSGHADSAERIRSVALAAGLDEAKQWKCQLQGPWTVKLWDTFGGFDPIVYVDAEAVIQSNGQVDITAKVDRVVKRNQSPVVMRTKSVDVRYVFKEVRKQPDGTFLLVHGFTSTVVHERESFITNGFTTLPPEISTPNWHQAKIDPSAGLSGIAKFFAGSEGKASWSSARTDDPPATASGFAGLWDVYTYPSATNPPAQPSRVKIAIEGNEAVAFEELGAMSNVAYRGPLSDGGSVWNAAKKVGAVIVMKVENARLSPDGNRFEGTWSGAAPHGYPIKGVRAGTGGLAPPPPVPTPTPTPSEVSPPSAGEIQVSNATPHQRVSLPPGGTLKVGVALAGGTGFSVQAVSPPAGAATMMRGPAIEYPTSGKLGASTIHHYEYRVAASPPREFQIAYRLMRGAASGGQYDVTVTVVGSEAPPTPPVILPTTPPVVKPPVIAPIVAPPITPPKVVPPPPPLTPPQIGTAETVVPNVVGMDPSAARTSLEAKGLKFNGPPGGRSDKVAVQQPTAGTKVAAGSAVSILFRSAPPDGLVIVPNLNGMDLGQANEALTKVNLKLQYKTDSGGGFYEAAYEKVYKQDPEAGAKVTSGATVLVYTHGSQTRVPMLDGYKYDEVKDKLDAVKLALKADGDLKNGVAVKVDPQSAWTVPNGSTIKVTFGSNPGWIAVPNVIGMNEADARSALKKVGFYQIVNDGDPKTGPVSKQAPEPGNLADKGHGILLTYRGDLVAVPHVVGATESVALSVLRSAGLNGNVNGDPKLGAIENQIPKAGEYVAKGSIVKLYFPHVPGATVPSVVGLTDSQARARLEQFKLTMLTVGDPQSGPATSQTPAAGTMVNQGSTVTVTFPPTQMTFVPSVVGLRYEQCIARLQESNLKLQMQGNPQQGAAMSQTPSAGAKVKVGTAVVVVFPSVPPPVAVPNVIGMTAAAARSEITSHGLVYSMGGGDPAGKASRQVPPSGSVVPKGATVVVNFTAAPPPPQAMVSVPNVLGVDYSTAMRQLQSVGLVPRPSGDVQSGRVRHQTPMAGSMVPRGSSVALEFVKSGMR